MPQYISGALLIDPINTKVSEPQGRLTLTTLVPVLTAAVAASASVFYTPYKGNKIPIWNGVSFEMRTFAELTNTFSDATVNPAAAVPNGNYDFYVSLINGILTLTRSNLWSKNATVTTPVATPGVVNWTGHALLAGTPVSFSGGVLPTGIVAGTTYFVIAAGLGANSFEISATVGGAAINFTGSSSGTQTGVAGNDTARSTATENDLQMVQGILVNLNAIANGPAAGYGTYVGSGRTDSTGATISYSFGAGGAGGTIATFHVYNEYNQTHVETNILDTGAGWTYSSATIRAVNNSTTNRCSYIRGTNKGKIRATYQVTAQLAAAVGAQALMGIGVDTTTVYSTQVKAINPAAVLMAVPMVCNLQVGNLGSHFIVPLESGDGTNLVTWSPTASSAYFMVGMDN